MGYSSQAGHLIAMTQANPGVFEPTLPAAGQGIALRSGALGASRELLETDPEIGGGRDRIDAYLGASSWSGDYEFYARVNAVATLLRAALGVSSSVITSGVTVHTLTPSDQAQLPFLSLQEKIGNGLECYNYTDAVVNTFHLEVDANGYLMGTAGIIAKQQVAGITPGVPANDLTSMFVGTNVSVTYNGVTLPAKSFSMDINNNFEDDDFRLGSFFLNDLTPKRREINASFGLRETSSALWRQAVYGASGATSPGGLVAKYPLVITATAYESIPGGTPATPYSIQITIPKFALSPYSISVSGDDIIESDIEGSALKPVAATPIMTAVLKTGSPAII